MRNDSTLLSPHTSKEAFGHEVNFDDHRHSIDLPVILVVMFAAGFLLGMAVFGAPSA